MARLRLWEEITYYFETFLERLGRISQWWHRLPWETKVKSKAAISALGMAATYVIYFRYWGELGDLGRWGLYLLILLVALLTITTAAEVLVPSRFK